jgi:hypothetical protein
MKKWLNIKPQVYDFSEDEADTETESEDDCMVLACLPCQVNCFAFCALIMVSAIFVQLALLQMPEFTRLRIFPIGHRGTNPYAPLKLQVVLHFIIIIFFFFFLFFG